ncbi:hypothetical protein M0R45_029569 [Rubus argutus]|uniref:Uncharacterized protein n=1 Tax=Rubus argutus TaxID=59490 RepID=A0AAW1W8G4_RUBAR
MLLLCSSNIMLDKEYYSNVQSASVFSNKSEPNVWPGTLNSAQQSTTGFELLTRATNQVTTPVLWNGCFWARTGCSTATDGKFTCAQRSAAPARLHATEMVQSQDNFGQNQYRGKWRSGLLRCQPLRRLQCARACGLAGWNAGPPRAQPT